MGGIERLTVVAAWCVTVPAAVVAGCSMVGLLALGPFGLVALPFVLPPLAVLVAQARTGYRVARGSSTSTRGLLVSTLAVAALLVALAVFARSEDTGRPGALNTAAALAAAWEAAAAAALLPRARPGSERPPMSRVVAMALGALAVAQLVALTVPRASTSPLP